MSLAEGSFLKIHEGEDIGSQELYLQIMEVKKMPNGRYKLKLNDQKNWMWGVVPATSNSIFDNGEAVVGTVINVTQHVVNSPGGNKTMIMKEWAILQKDCEILGEPQPLPASKPAGFGGNAGGFGGGNQNAAGFGGGRANNPFGGGASTTNGPGGTGGGDDLYQPVTQLSPFQKTFKIKVRVTNKGAMKEWSNQRGSGKLFSVDLLDQWGGEIQATCFNEAAEKLFPTFEVGKVYTISKGRIKVANKKWTHIQNDYQLDLNEHSEVVYVGEDAKIKTQQYDFVTLDRMHEKQDKDYADVIGVCDNVGDIQNFTSQRSGKELTKRTFRIVDHTSTAIECTLWGNVAQNLDADSVMNQVVAMKAARVSDFNGKSLSVNGYEINPDCPETGNLQKWWSNGGSEANVTSMTQGRGGGGGRNEPPITLQEMDERRLGTNIEKPDYFNVVATILRIPVDMEKRTPWYNAVPTDEGPAYKVVEDPNGGSGWWCEKLQKSFNDYRPRYVMRARIGDCSGSEWVNMYDDVASQIVGKSAKEMESIWNNQKQDEFNGQLKGAEHKTWNLRCRAKQDEYQGESRRRIDAVGASQINFVEDALRMSQAIEAML